MKLNKQVSISHIGMELQAKIDAYPAAKVSISHIGMEPNLFSKDVTWKWSINLSYRYGTEKE